MSHSASLLFCTGVARSGSNLLCRMLSAHSQVMVPADPYMPLFRSLRGAIVADRASAGAPWFDPQAPFHDYYFVPEHLGLLDWIQEANLDLPFREEPTAFLERCRARMSLEAADLVPLLPSLPGDTYRRVFDNALEIIASGRKVPGARWLGFKELWTVEFCAPLLRSKPDAKFIAILRDPRATVASMLAFTESDPTQVAHVLSYARHWRKYVALVEKYRTDPAFEGRFLVTTYERLAGAPEATARELCRFLEIDYQPAMLDADSYFDHSTGKTWRGNSSFTGVKRGIDKARIDQWKTVLDSRVARMVDFVCGPEMKIAGYEPSGEAGPHPSILEYLAETNDQPVNWRSDFRDPVRDYGSELVRHSVLAMGERAPADLVRRCFLFEQTFRSAIRPAPVSRA